MVNIAAAIAVIAALLYDSAGSYRLLALGVAGFSALFALCLYFRFHWGNKLAVANSEVETAVDDCKAMDVPVAHLAVPTYLIPVRIGELSTELVISDSGRVHRINVEALLSYLKFMESRGWSAPEFPELPLVQRQRDLVRRHAMGRSKQPLSKAPRFRVSVNRF
jgi:hypothetical protein